MRALVLKDRAAGPAGLAVTELPHPQPSENDVVVRVHAAGFNRTELDWPGIWSDRSGHARTSPVPGHELSGVVTELGYGTTGLQVGQRVMGFADGTRDGSLAEYVSVEARNLTPLPPDVDHETAAALPISGLAAWQSLFVHADVGAGDRVLIHGSEGAVGTLAVQLAAQAGAYVIATGRNSDGRHALHGGAAQFLDLGTERLENIDRVDFALDVVGGEVLQSTRPLIRPGGTLVSVFAPVTDPLPDARTVFFVIEPDRATLARLVRDVRRGLLSPRLDAVCTLENAPAAFTTPGRTIVRLID